MAYSQLYPFIVQGNFQLLCRRLFLALKGLKQKKKRLLSCIFFVYYKHLFNLLQFEVKNKKVNKEFKTKHISSMCAEK